MNLKKKFLKIRDEIKLLNESYYNSQSQISDADFDKQCLEVDLSIDTVNKELDSFFRKEFDPSTGQWIHKHPEKRKIGLLLRETNSCILIETKFISKLLEKFRGKINIKRFLVFDFSSFSRIHPF